MAPDDGRTQQVESRLLSAKHTASELAAMIVDAQSRGYLLDMTLNWLQDIENFVLPQAAHSPTIDGASGWLRIAEFQLRIIENQLEKTRKLLITHGRDLRVVGS